MVVCTFSIPCSYLALTPFPLLLSKRPQITNVSGVRGTCLHCWWECKLVQPLWKTVSVQFSHSFVSDSLWPHGLQYARLPCPSPASGAYSDVHCVGEAIQPPHPLSSPCPPAFNLSQDQGIFRWVSSSHQVAKVLEFQLQHQSFQWIFRTDFL